MTYETSAGANMFAYCMNNPVNYFDPSGCARISDFINGVKETISQYIEAQLYMDSIITEALKNLELTTGVGQGMYGSCEVFDIGLSGGFYGNYAEVDITKSKIQFHQTLYFGGEIGLGVMTAEMAQCSSFINGKEISSGSNEPFCVTFWGVNSPDEVTLWSGAAYLFVGLSAEVRFNVNGFIDGVRSLPAPGGRK